MHTPLQPSKPTCGCPRATFTSYYGVKPRPLPCGIPSSKEEGIPFSGFSLVSGPPRCSGSKETCIGQYIVSQKARSLEPPEQCRGLRCRPRCARLIANPKVIATMGAGANRSTYKEWQFSPAFPNPLFGAEGYLVLRTECVFPPK